MIAGLPDNIDDIKGLLAKDEAEALYRSAVAARERDGTVFALGHHRGSEEHQPGELFHDPDLYDATSDGIDSFGEFRRNLRRAGVEDRVVPIVAGSTEAALEDYRCWASHIVRGGILAIHDVYPDAYAGGQAPWAVFQMARSSGLFEDIERVSSLGLLRRL